MNITCRLKSRYSAGGELMKQKATESEINNYKQFENMQFLKPHELGGVIP